MFQGLSNFMWWRVLVVALAAFILIGTGIGWILLHF